MDADKVEVDGAQLTLGDIANVFQKWKEAGITRESVQFVTNKVWWEY